MGLFSSVSRLSEKWLGRKRGVRTQGTLQWRRACRVEELETRRYMTADLPGIHVGAVYLDPASGNDSQPNLIQVMFQGGAPGTELTRLVIDGSKAGGPLATNDMIFDTAPGGLGAYASHPLQIVSHEGFSVLGSHVEDGSTKVTFDLQGFKAGMKLVFSVDVDQVTYVDPVTGDVETDAVAEGAEFQRSHFLTTFQSPHFQDITAQTLFWDAFDSRFASDDAQSGLRLDLPNDQYSLTQDLSVLSAGATAVVQQVPLPITIGGTVFDDHNLNNHQDSGDLGIAGVSLALWRFDGSQYANTGKTASTDGQGNYKFDGVLPGRYEIIESQPVGYVSVGAQAGTVAGLVRGVVVNADVLANIDMQGGEDSVQNNFAEARPATLSGFVYHDRNNNGIRQNGEEGIGGVAVLVQPISTVGTPTRPIQTTTNADGSWSVSGLNPGTYRVVEPVQPAGYLDGLDAAGTAGGVAVNPGDEINNIFLASAQVGQEYDFGEILPGLISGHVRVTTTQDCETDPLATPLAGVTIELLDSSGKVVGTTQTDDQGYYQFAGLPLGSYGVHEIQPAGYYDADDHVGTAGGVLVNVETISSIVLASGTHGLDYDFCVQPPASLTGWVHVETGGDCLTDPNPTPMAGVVIHLLDTGGHVVQTTTTDAAGNYSFTQLAPGTYSVREEQPAGFFDGDEHAGTAGGDTSRANLIGQISLSAAVNATGYDFCEVPPASISGFVYYDANNNGTFDVEETGIGGVTLILKDADGRPTGKTTVTNADGSYTFADLPPGVYSIAEVQPAGYLDGLDSAGNVGGTAINPGDLITGIPVDAGIDATDYNFGELLPASIRGRVDINSSGNCAMPGNETPLPGVTINLLDAGGQIVATTVSDSQGNYAFAGLVPGTYQLQKIEPKGYFNAGDHVGSAGGDAIDDDNIIHIALGSGLDAVDYNFCETLPGSISGIVFQDGPPIVVGLGETPDVAHLRNGILTPDDKRLPGITLELRDGVTGEPILGSHALPGLYAPNAPIRTITDANGFYEFAGLPAGNYAVYEVHPDGYIDGYSTPGTLGGIAIHPYTTVSPEVLTTLEVKPGGEAILRIPLFAGQRSLENNFSQVITTPLVFFLPPPPPPPVTPSPTFDVPAPEVVIPPPPDQPFLLTPVTIFGGAGAVIGYTWHLSVVDAGQPRGPGVEEAVVKLTGMRLDELAWMQNELSEGHWTLKLRTKDPKAGGTREVTFGIRGAKPVTGDFNGDGITEIGVYKDGQWFLDVNGNGIWDEADLWGKLGRREDLPVTGDWDGDGKTDIGVFGPAWPGDPRAVAAEPGLPDPHNKNTDVHKNMPPPPHRAAIGVRALKLTSQGKIRADLIDHVFHYGRAGDTPLVGDWNGDGIATIGVFNNGTWYLDVDGDGAWSDNDLVLNFGQAGDIPVVGDWNGDGIDDIGVYRNGTFYLDTNGNGILDPEDEAIQLGNPGDVPVVGDWDGDGRTDVGVYHD